VGHSVGIDEQAEEGLAIAVAAADDLLLPLVPAVDVDEVVEEALDVGDELFARFALALRHGAIGVARADDVGDAVFKSRYKTYILGFRVPTCSAWGRGRRFWLRSKDFAAVAGP